jgi:hypothetical protein
VKATAKALTHKPRLKYEHVDNLSLTPNFMEDVDLIDQTSKEGHFA